MSTGALAVLFGSVVMVFVAGISALGSLALLWAYSKLKPQEEIFATLSAHRALLDELERQVIRLRTSRAGTRSASKKAEAAEQESQDQEDPLLAGLSEEDRALFR